MNAAATAKPANAATGTAAFTGPAAVFSGAARRTTRSVASASAASASTTGTIGTA